MECIFNPQIPICEQDVIAEVVLMVLNVSLSNYLSSQTLDILHKMRDKPRVARVTFYTGCKIVIRALSIKDQDEDEVEKSVRHSFDLLEGQ